MPTPFMCHWCDKPTTNEAGICIECEQRYEEGNKDIAANARELETRIRRYEDAMKEILDCCDLKNEFMLSPDDTAFANDIKEIAHSSLNGEPTTADEHNKSFVQYRDTGDENVVRISDVNKEIAEEWNRDREEKIKKKANMIESIGYRGEE